MYKLSKNLGLLKFYGETANMQQAQFWGPISFLHDSSNLVAMATWRL